MNEKEDLTIRCITEHPGFEGVCLNPWVLETAYYQYRQDYKTDAEHHEAHEYVFLTLFMQNIPYTNKIRTDYSSILLYTTI